MISFLWIKGQGRLLAIVSTGVSHGVGFRVRMVDISYCGNGLAAAMNKMFNENGG